MNDEITQPPGPRKYVVRMDVSKDKVGPIFSALITEVDHPTLTTGENGQHRITVICLKDQLSDIVPLINDQCDRIFIGPYNPEAKPAAPAVFKPPKPVTVQTPLERDLRAQTIRPKLIRTPGGSNARDTQLGKIIMAKFRERALHYLPDLADALTEAGFNGSSASPMLSRLVSEGDLVRLGRGAYRLPTTRDTPEQSGSTNSG